MKRLLLIVVALVVVVLVAVVLFLFTGLNGAIKAIVESVGSRATGTEVTLAAADVSLTSGDGTLRRFVVGNPKGYSSPSAIEFSEVHVKVETSSVTSDPVVIKEVLIDGPHLTFEVGPGGSNLSVIQDNVNAFRGGSGGGEEKTPGGRKFVIEDLIVRGGRVDVSASFLKGQKLGAALGEIHLRDIGKSEGGATAGEVAKELLGALVSSALDAVKGLNVDELKGALDKNLGGVLKTATDLLGGKKKK